MTTTIGYIGLNHHHARPYLETLRTLPVSVVAACEPDPSVEPDPGTFPGLAGTELYRDPVALFEEVSPDVVWLTLSNQATPDVIEAAVARGIDVFTEKPAARTAAELEPVVETVERSGATVGVSTPWRAHPAARELKRRAEAGFFGDVRALEARFFASQLAHRDTDHYLYDRAASRGGILQWLGVHWLDLIEWLLEPSIERVSASTTHGTDAVDVEDGAVLQYELSDGALGSLQCGYYLLEGRYDTTVSVTGTDGRAIWDPMGETFDFSSTNELHLEAPEHGSEGSPRRTLTYEYGDVPGYAGEFGREFVASFLQACENSGTAPPATLAEMKRRLRILDAAYRSANERGWQPVAANERTAFHQN